MANFKDIPSALKYIVRTKGINVLKSQTFINLLDDYQLFNGNLSLKNSFKIFLTEGLIEEAIHMGKGDSEERKLITKIGQDYCFDPFITQYIIRTIRYSLGLNNKIPTLETSFISNTKKCSNNSNMQIPTIPFEDSSLKFMGIRLGSDIDEFINILLQKGFEMYVKDNNLRGTFLGFPNTSIQLNTFGSTSLVNMVQINISASKEMITEIYSRKYQVPKPKYPSQSYEIKSAVLSEGRLENKIEIKISDGSISWYGNSKGTVIIYDSTPYLEKIFIEQANIDDI